MGRKVPHHCTVWPRAKKRPINLWWDQGPQSDPSVCNAAKGRKVAHHCVEWPKSGIWWASGIWWIYPTSLFLWGLHKLHMTLCLYYHWQLYLHALIVVKNDKEQHTIVKKLARKPRMSTEYQGFIQCGELTVWVDLTSLFLPRNFVFWNINAN